MFKLLRIAFKEFKSARFYPYFMAINLSLGLVGFLSMYSLDLAVKTDIRSRTKTILGGDVSVSAARKFSEDESRIIEENLLSKKSTEIIEMFAMVSGNSDKSRLVQLQVVDSNFPLVGGYQLEKFYAQNEKENDFGLCGRESSFVVLAPEILQQLGIRPQDGIKIGGHKFTILALLKYDPSNAPGSLNFAPKVIICRSELEKTGLLQTGSRVSFRRLFQFDTKIDADRVRTQISVLKNKLGENSDLNVQYHEDASEVLGRLFVYLSDYLGLVSIVAIILGSIGTIYLSRSFFLSKSYDMAIYRSLGLTPFDTLKIFLSFMIVIALIAAMFASIGALVGIPILRWLVEAVTQQTLELRLGFFPIVMSVILSVVVSILSSLPLLVSSVNISPRQLLGEKKNLSFQSINFRDVLSYIPLLVFFVGLSLFQSNSIKIAFWFSGAMILVACILGFLPWFLMRSAEILFTPRRFYIRLALLNLRRKYVESASCFVAVGLGITVSSLIPQLQKILSKELEITDRSKLPSLFLFDIQEEQLKTLEEVLSKDGFSLRQKSALVRARLEAINGVTLKSLVDSSVSSATKTREQEERIRSLKRVFNLSYRSELSESESLVQGRGFSSPYFEADGNSNKLPEISLEKRFAERLGVSIGDTLEFDILGVYVKGVVVNFRTVKWTSFQPNFFVQFQPGVFDEAPKTFLSSLYVGDEEARIQLQSKIVEVFPNISIIDVSSTVEKILGVIQKISWALKAMAYFSIAVGLVVLFSMLQHQALQNKNDFNLLKVLGCDFSEIKNIARFESLILVGTSSVVGLTLSYGLSFLLTYFLFDGMWVFVISEPLLVCFLTGGTAYLLSSYSSRKILNSKSWEILKST